MVLQLLFGWIFQLLGKLAWVIYFSIFPACLIVALVWLARFTHTPFVLESTWTLPALLAFSVFVTGVMIGAKNAREDGRMGMFLLGIVSQLCFAGIAWFDMHGPAIYTHYMPHVQSAFIPTITMALPIIGICGMTFFRTFVLKED